MLLRAVAGILGLGLCAIAVVMLIDPLLWYATLPGVSSSGSFNGHFVRDLGCANLVAGAVLLVRALARTTPLSALLAVAGFMSLHAGVHVWELSGAGHDAGHRVLRDIPTVYLPAILTVWFAVDAGGRARVLRRI